MVYLLAWFYELNMGRAGNGFGMNLLSYGEIFAWSRLTKRVVSAWEIGILKALDMSYVSLQNQKKAA